MTKIKSVIMTVIISIVIVILSLMCFIQFPIPFRVGGIWKQYNSVVSLIEVGADIQGGYSATYYPEGVISKEEFDQTMAQYQAQIDAGKDVDYWTAEKDEYEGKYNAYGSLYLSKDISSVENEGTENEKTVPTQAFKKDFDHAAEVMAKRFEQKNFTSLSVSKVNDFTIRVELPSSVSNYAMLFGQMGLGGEFYIKDAENNGKLLPKTTHSISEYISGASSVSNGDKGYVVMNLTPTGRAEIKKLTQQLKGDENGQLQFFIGEESIIEWSVTSVVDSNELSLGGSFSPADAENYAILINSCVKDGALNLTLKVDSGNVASYTVKSVDNVKLAIYIILGVSILLMLGYSIFRYKGLGVTHLFGFMSYLICMLMFMGLLPNMVFTSATMWALIVTGVMTVLSNFYVFEMVRKEFSKGKTLDAAIKDGYKACAAPLLDTHIALFIMGLVLYFASIGEMVAFAYIFVLGVLMSCLVSLLLTRFYWYCMRGLVKRIAQYKFCGFKREVYVDDDED